MTITLHPATRADEPVLRRLLELYLHDFSGVSGADLDEHGRFGYPYLDRCWTEPDRSAFLLRVDGRLAGFVLVNGHTYTDESEHAIAEFFVVRKYRRRGVGRRAAIAVFERVPGAWEVPVHAGNAVAWAFWRSTIEAYVGTGYEVVEHEGWPGSVFRFTAAPSGQPRLTVRGSGNP